MLGLSIFSIIILTLLATLWQKYGRRDATVISEKETKIERLQRLAAHDEVAASLATLINRDGAGDWPPRSNYKCWPKELLPYQKILLEVLPSLATRDPSLDAATDVKRRGQFRESMEKLLRENVHLPSVIEVLSEIETNTWENLSRDALNGFFCCIALSRHAYRWALMPVVKVAQVEDVVVLPAELDFPWPYLQRYFGFEADSGNHTSNVLLNFGEDGMRAFIFNSTLPLEIQSTEEAFFRLLHDIESMGFDIFYEIVIAIISLREGRSDSCLESLREIDVILSRSLNLFHAQMREGQISRKFWLSYVQGFHGWGVGRHINSNFVRFNGVSGNHILLFQVLDAFLGMERYLSDEDMALYIPLHQRLLCQTVKKHSIRQHIGDDDSEVAKVCENIVRKLKAYRSAHRSRVMPYLKQPAPERFHMTAGKSVLTTDLNVSIDEAIAPLDKMLATRLSETR
ncbi:hypothetical protein F4802DRAFT_607951 [Xylaria palmicola]|nr:hypothetical protein F4802DRAFT_607951 [Xylaria palmicola]